MSDIMWLDMDTDEPDRRKVFVIYGRNERAKSAIFTFLWSIGLEPIEWSHAIEMTGQGSPYIGDVLETALATAQALIVLMTPDDVVYLDSRLADGDDPELEPQAQPRPNVLFEAGMAMAHDAKRTIIVEFGKVKVFSDIHGRHVIRLDASTEKRQELANRLRNAGCAVNLRGTEWQSAGDLTPPPPLGNGLATGKRVPRATESSGPRLDARYINRGSRSFGGIEVMNYGPGDVLQLDLAEQDKEGRGRLRGGHILPIEKLPAGKSVIAADYLGNIFAGSHKTHTTLLATGRTDDGHEISQELFISLGA